MLATCSGTGFPRPSITWAHNGKPLNNSASSRITINENATEEDSGLISVMSFLEICSVRVADGGVYECIVANRLANDSACFTLTVRGNSN